MCYYSFVTQELSQLLEHIGESLPALVAEVPLGMSKVAGLRDGVDPLPPVTLQNIWRHPNAHPLVLDVLLLDRYGVEYLDWEPEVVRETLLRNSTPISTRNWTKIQAIRVTHRATTPWRQWEVLHWISQGLDGTQPTITFMELPEIGVLASAIDILKTIDKTVEFSDEIQKFVAATARYAGIPFLPPPLDFAQRELDQAQVRCRNCETIVRDDNDQRCVHCASTDLEHDILDSQWSAAKTAVKTAWEAQRGKRLEDVVSGLGDSAEDHCIYSLAIHWDYRNQVRQRLVDQLKMIRKSG